MRRKPLAPLTPEQQQLAADNERLIYLAIHRYAPDEDADELYGHAAEGLLRAASTYDPTRGKFSTHAMWCIRSEIAHRKKYAQQRKRSGMLILYTDDNDTAFDSAGKYDHTQRGAVKPKDRPHRFRRFRGGYQLFSGLSHAGAASDRVPAHGRVYLRRHCRHPRRKTAGGLSGCAVFRKSMAGI